MELLNYVGEGEMVSGAPLCGTCFIIRLNMGLHVYVYVLFICSFCALRLLCKSIPIYSAASYSFFSGYTPHQHQQHISA
jgi:hypothetical protein